MKTNNTLESLAAEIVAKTGCPINVAREYIHTFLSILKTPERMAEVIAGMKGAR